MEICVALICINMTSRDSMSFSSFFSCLNSLYSPLLSSLPRRHFPFSCILPHAWEQQTVVWRLKNSEHEMLRFRGEKKILPVKTQVILHEGSVLLCGLRRWQEGVFRYTRFVHFLKKVWVVLPWKLSWSWRVVCGCQGVTMQFKF